MKQPIAMKCTKKDLKKIQPKLKGWNFTDIEFNLKKYPYLTNNYGNPDSEDLGSHDYEMIRKGTEVYEEWNEKIFLEACGIEVEKTFSVTESQIKELDRKFNLDTELCLLIRNMFPEAFESKVRSLPKDFTGWVKDKCKGCEKFIAYSENGIILYGFNVSGEWVGIDDVKIKLSKNEYEATEQEVFEALKNEAVKRYKEKMIIPLNIDLLDGYKNNYQELYFEKYCRLDDYNRLWVNFGKWNAVVFDNGKWAEIIQTITLSEAEQQLKKKIIVQ